MGLYYQLIIKNIHWIIILLGATLRIREYLAARSLDMDEAHWALLIIREPINMFFSVMNGNQSAPPFFLIIEKIVAKLLGSSEYALRLLPLILGLLSLLLFYKVARRLLPKWFALIALTLFVLSDYHILYSTIVKRYSGDIFFALLILFIALKLFDKKQWGFASLAPLMITGIIAPWISYTSIFIMAGVGLVLLLSAILKKDLNNIGKLLFVFILWGINLALLYIFHLRLLEDFYNYHKDFFKSSYAPLPNSLESLNWYIKSFNDYFDIPLGLSSFGLGLTLFLFGSLYSLFTDKIKFILLFSPLLMALLASSQQRYPFVERYLLFTVPTTLILVVVGIQFIAFRLKRLLNSKFMIGSIIVITGLLLIQPLMIAKDYLINPVKTVYTEETKSVIDFLRKHKRSNDLVYVYYGAIPAFRYYNLRYNLDDLRIVEGIKSRENPVKYINDLNKLTGEKRVWILFSHRILPYEERFFLEYLNKKGKLLLESSGPYSGASIYLYDLRSK